MDGEEFDPKQSLANMQKRMKVSKKLGELGAIKPGEIPPLSELIRALDNLPEADELWLDYLENDPNVTKLLDDNIINPQDPNADSTPGLSVIDRIKEERRRRKAMGEQEGELLR